MIQFSTEALVSCASCGWSTSMDTDLPDQITVFCGGCTHRLGKWRDVKLTAKPAAKA